MLNKMFYTVITVFILSISAFSYAITTSSRVELTCKPQTTSQSTKYTRPGDPNVQYSITFNGIWVNGYTNGLIQGTIDRIDRSILKTLSSTDSDIQTYIEIHIDATCTGSNNQLDMDKGGDTLVCKKGEGILIELYHPECGGSFVGSKGIFTLTETRDDGNQIVTMPPVPVNATGAADLRGASIMPQRTLQPVVSGSSTHHKSKCEVL